MESREWLTRYITYQQKQDRKLINLLEKASRDADKGIRALAGKTNISAKVEATRLREVRSQIERLLEKLWSEIGNQVAAGQHGAAALSLENSFDWDSTLLRAVYPDADTRDAMRRYLSSSGDRNLQAAFARQGNRPPLSLRVYRSRQLSTGWVTRTIDSSLARGLNYKQLADEVRSSIRPDTPGGVAYAAKRLARTEINAAYHAVTVEQNRLKPWNTSMTWALSKSHPTPDICNLYADRSPYDLGAVPDKPHPQCLCYTYANTVSSEEFVRAWRAGEYDMYISENYGQYGRSVA